MSKKLNPAITNMVKNMPSVDRFQTLTADVVFQYIKNVHALIEGAATSNNPTQEIREIVQMIQTSAQELPVDHQFGTQIVFNAPLFAHAVHNAHPIIAIDNPELIEMLRDTDVTHELLQNVQLPFDEFIVCFEYRGFTFEAVACRVLLDSKSMEVKHLYIEEGTPFYASSGYMYRSGGKRAVVELYDMDVSTTNTTFNFFAEIPDTIKEIMLEAVKIFNGLFLYLSLPRTVEYIQGKKQVIRKATQQFPKHGAPAYLFNDVRYAYQKQSSSGDGSGKRSHLVRGHMRNQPFGKRDNPEYKVVWIEPYFTTGDDRKSKEYKLN